MGSAYTAQASDAYAPTWNPGGLGFLDSTQLSGMHLSYLESIHYEFLSFVHPLRVGRSLGMSIQYLGSGDIAATDLQGQSIGEFSGHYAAYSLAYGQSLSPNLSLGATAKLIHARISDATAKAYAFDLGSICKPLDNLTLGIVLANLGASLKFVEEGDSLPLALRTGAAFQPGRRWTLALEGVYRKTGLASAHTGIEWTPVSILTLRTGYKTETIKQLSPMAGLTTGAGLHLGKHELAYAWNPLGDLGNTHYFSFLTRFGQTRPAEGKGFKIPYFDARPDKHEEADIRWKPKKYRRREQPDAMSLPPPSPTEDDLAGLFEETAAPGNAEPSRLANIPRDMPKRRGSLPSDLPDSGPYLLPAPWDTEKVSPMIAQPSDQDLLPSLVPEGAGPSLASTNPSVPVQLSVMFQYENRRAKKVELAGDFNHWTPEPMLQDVKGVWIWVKDLPPGTYRYQFLVNGKPRTDPWNARKERDPKRGRVSVAVVAPQPLGPQLAARVQKLLNQDELLAQWELEERR